MLYLVSTPIGNLGDFSERARQTLEYVDIVACEDTRTSGQLFSLLGIKVAAVTPYHEHNAETARPKLIEKLKKGVNIALVSDAGTPLISDPGYKLVRDCQTHHIPVTTIPGANAVLSALQLSGLPTDAFLFAGFLPSKSGARKHTLETYQTVPATLIFYETANRLNDSLQDICTVLGNREMAVVREITKKFEETRRDTVENLIRFYADEENTPRGEIVLVINRFDGTTQYTDLQLDDLIQNTLQNHSVRDTVDIVTGQTGKNKKQIYKRVLELAQ
ncbi:MAG: 16S rRNA (cytidine(1402)-2'-O)-methyltransferase [Alphaproteobacteria bacterium]|nr:16S rRNA (cytidine(1402)-2'-O)-methyltransferase [Alphaproteobacteria bacterium]MBQ9089746.1 16S rRNA (cytidine(1402)-2'-O)-methyltransferase [Alphaproteobacteria bacterium]